MTARLHRLSRPPWPILLTLVVGQWAALATFVAFVRHNGWLFYQGGDETFYYTTAWAIAHGHVPEASIGYGWSYVLAPLAGVAGPNLLVALPAIVLLQVIVLLPVALLCVYEIAARIGGRRVGYFAAVLWVVVPYALIPLWADRFEPKYVEQLLPQALGLTALADFPSMVCLLVSATFCLRGLDRAGRLDWAVSGAAAGFAIGIKPSNALFLGAPLVALAVRRGGRDALEFAAALAPALVTLALWKYRGLGHVPAFTPAPEAIAMGRTAAGSVQVHRYLNLDWTRLRDNYRDLGDLLIGAVAFQALPLLGFGAAARRVPAKALVLLAWCVPFLLVKGSAADASLSGGSLLRLLIPAFPAILLLVALVPMVDRSFRHIPIPRSRPFGRRAAGVAAALALVLPLVLIAALPSLRSPDVAKYFDESVLIPVSGSPPAVSLLPGGRRELHWSMPASPGVEAAFRVFRARPVAAAPDPTLPPGRDGIRCLAPPSGYAGAEDCRLEMTLLATTRSTSFIDKPPPGRWVWRIGMFANWRRDLDLGDVMLLSHATNPGRSRTRLAP